MMFSASFEPKSLSVIARLYGFQTLLSAEVQEAMRQAGDMLTASAKANTQTAFQNPTGKLADSIVPVIESPYELQIGVGVPYGRRLELGFVGTDSLGRNYNQAPEPYLQPALDVNTQAILQLFDIAVEHVFTQIQG